MIAGLRLLNLTEVQFYRRRTTEDRNRNFQAGLLIVHFFNDAVKVSERTIVDTNHFARLKQRFRTRLIANLLHNYPWLLAVVLFFAATLLYSQAATTKALMPAALLLGVSPLTAIASFAAVSALFVLPTYPTLLAAVEMDDTGSTRIGKYVFNHAFLIPGVIAITLCVILGFIFGGIML